MAKTSSANTITKVPGMDAADAMMRPAPEWRKNRLIYSIEGQTKTQKSSFGLWGPPPVMLFDIDHRVEGVVELFEDGTRTGKAKIIRRHYVQVPELAPMAKKLDEAAKKSAQFEWDKLVQLYGIALESSLKAGGIRTIVMDDITELYDLRLISEFGRTQAIQQRDRGAANFDMLKLIDMGKDYAATVIWISKVKEEWGTNAAGENKPTGQWIPDGYKRLRQTVQVALRAQINSKKRFEIEVLSSGLNAETNGLKYTADDWRASGPFAWVSHEQVDGSIPDDWVE